MQKCAQCNKKVTYLKKDDLELIKKFPRKLYHSQCVKCPTCKKPLKEWTPQEKEFYIKFGITQLFTFSHDNCSEINIA